jgi:hypothetical protein
LIDGCDLVFLAKSKDGDHHQEMNSVVFLEWFENQLIPALKDPSYRKMALFLATKPLTCAHINSIGLSSQCRTGVLITSCLSLIFVMMTRMTTQVKV